MLLIAVAFGSANYVNAQPHSFGAAFRFWSAVVVALSCGLGARVSSVRLRRADVERDSARLVGGLTPVPVVAGIAISGLTAGAGGQGLLVVLVSGTLGAAAGALLGTGREGSR